MIKNSFKYIIISILIIVSSIGIFIVFSRGNEKKQIGKANDLSDKKQDEHIVYEEKISDDVVNYARKGTSKEGSSDISGNNLDGNLFSSDKTESETKNNIGIGDTKAAINSSQLITVANIGGSDAELTLWEKDKDNNWNSIIKTFARIGLGGMKNASEVYEMDLCTPTGSYSLSEGFGICENPGSIIPYRVLDGSEYWVDDENSQYYNTMQFGTSNGRWTSAEHLISYPVSYNYSVVIDYNRYQVIPGKSSAIFLHCDTGKATLGCVAVDENSMINIIKHLDIQKNPQIILDFNYENIYNNY